MKRSPILLHFRYLCSAALAVGILSLAGCDPKKSNNSDDSEEDDTEESDEDDSSESKGDKEEGKSKSTEEKDSKTGSKSEGDKSTSGDKSSGDNTGPKGDCKLAPLTTVYPDTNPTSPTFKKRLGPRDFQGAVTLWTIAFDCNC